ncbi:MAG: UpxY family transcription antiterminator [Acidobacteriia bacterium]|nr:UpxY family transcription antiterminator [Terriglobia bacterium]
MVAQGLTVRLPDPELSGMSLSEAVADQFHPHWYAAYTCANHEKRVSEQLAGRGVELFLPRYQSLRRWKDRKVFLDLPLFPGYIFVRIPLTEQLRVLEVPSVVRLVGARGCPVPLDGSEIDRLRKGLEKAGGVLPHPFLKVGRHVRVCHGPFEGMVGILLRRKGTCRVVISIELIQRSICVEVETDAVEVLSSKPGIADRRLQSITAMSCAIGCSNNLL